MDPKDRIEELEAQVKELNDQVQGLRSHEASSPASPQVADEPSMPSNAPEEKTPDPIQETRLWEDWLNRMAVVLMMAAMVLLAGKTLQAEDVAAWQKVGIGYAIAAAGLAWGLLSRRHDSLVPQVALGTGLAALYFTTFGAFFLPKMQIHFDASLALVLLSACLGILVAVSLWRGSPLAALIGLSLVYYTAIRACLQGGDADRFVYAGGAFVAAGICAAVFHGRFRWRVFSWIGLLATYPSYIIFFRTQPEIFQISDLTYFWLTAGGLTLCYGAFSLATIVDAHRRDNGQRMIALFATLNSLVYFPLVWGGINSHYEGQAWLFRAAFGAVLALFALLSETKGARRNLLVQMFIATAVILFASVLEGLFAGGMVWVALALACLALAALYQVSGVVVLKALNLPLLLLVFVGCLFSLRSPGSVPVGSYLMPANWFYSLSVSGVLCLVAVYYEVMGRRFRPELRSSSGHWFLADSIFDAPCTTLSMLHAAAAALILVTVTILDQGEDPALPYFLAVESIIMALAGFALFTPQLEIGGVLLLVAAHVTFYFFITTDKVGFAQRGDFALATVLVAIYTYLAATLWERYLRRVEGGRTWGHVLIASVPYVGATHMLATFLGSAAGWNYEPLAYNGVGVLLLLTALFLPYTGLKLAGLTCLGVGTGIFVSQLYSALEGAPGSLEYLALLIPLLATYWIGERLVARMHKQGFNVFRIDDTVRTLLVAAGGALGMFALTEWADEKYLTLCWLAYGMALVIMGLACREARYRWAAVLILGVAVLWALFYDTAGMAWLYQLIGLAGLSATLLIIQRIHKRQRNRTQQTMQPDPPAEPPHDG
jgi:hypothetical protein